MGPSKKQEAPSRHSERQPGHERRRWPRPPQSEKETAPLALPALSPLHFSTRQLPREEQFGAWQAYMEPLVEVRLPDDVSPEDGFPAEHTAWNLGAILIVQQRTPAHSYMRSTTKLLSSSIDHWYIGLQRDGRAWTEVDGHVAEVERGKIEIRSLGYPYRGRTTDAEMLCLYMPRDLFIHASATLDANNNAVIRGNLARLLIDYLDGVETALRKLTAEDLPSIVHTTRDMIINCLPMTAERKAVAESQANLGLMERARRYIQNNLSSPDLTPDALCRALGISRTRLYQLFEPSGGVLHYIQKRRLFAAHVALSNPENKQRILDIAESVGFSSAANFSRAFSQKFGYSPREARDAAGFGRLAYSVAHGEQEDTSSSSSFEDWLKTLGT